MKKLLAPFSVVAFILIGCNLSPKNNVTQLTKTETLTTQTTAENTLILNNSVGDFKIGEKISAKNYTIKEDAITLMDEGEEWTEPIFKISANEEQLMVLKPKFDFEANIYTKNIGEIIVNSEKFKTEKGIGVNSTIGEFIAQYPNYKIWFTYIGGDRFVIETPDLNIKFLLDEKDYKGKIQVTGEETPLNIADFNPTAKIKNVRVL
ncbi:hypothetical protein EC396_09875 [Lutibacter sp. HS1-25]|uniref:hypothetical protein n=1 Tax=Lutibacter sp. HS1-25 TaxID=2485000 RepID=UPI0010107A91|nr:hypothetical protein [Lutibacter sp. HS1-25]RXP53794.1 hypothetical protein EC396_09875 [Lutibacter sp. HS1-25]